MQKTSILYLSFLVSILAISCRDSKVDDSISKIRFINASALSGNINVDIDYKKVFATDIEYLNYSLFSSHISTVHTIKVRTAGGSVIKDTAMKMIQNKTYTGIVYDRAGGTEFKIIEEDFSVPVGSYCKIRFLHLSNNSPASDITANNDTTVLFRNYANGDYSNYTIFGIDSMSFNAQNTGSTVPFYVQPRKQGFKAGYFYTLFLKGNIGSTGIDSVGFFTIENNGSY